MNAVVRQSLTRIKGTDVHWAEAGEGRPLVLLHGLADCHRTWQRVIPALAQSRRVLIPDLQGHGLSGRPDASYSLDWHADIIGAWLASLDLENVDVVGHSFGGGVAQWLLLAHRDRVRRLVLVAPGGLGREVAFGLRLAAITNTVERLGQPFMARGTRIAMRYFEGDFGAEDIELLSWMNAMPGTARAFARTVKDVIDWRGQRRHFLERAHEVAELPPIAVFWGDHDRVIPSHHANDLLSVIEGAEYCHFESCGHFPHREHPDLFVSRLEAFLDAPSAPSVRIPPSLFVPRRPTLSSLVARAWAALVAGVRNGIAASVRVRTPSIAA